MLNYEELRIKNFGAFEVSGYIILSFVGDSLESS